MKLIKLASVGLSAGVDSAAADLAAIAGEMINLESGKDAFQDGALKSDRPAGYPKFMHEDVEYTLQAVTGTIYIPNHLSMGDFQRQLMGAVKRAEYQFISAEGLHPLAAPVAISSGPCATIFAETHRTNRIITMTTDKELEARFIWFIKWMSDFFYTVHPLESLSVIIYDPMDVLIPAHGETITSLEVHHLRRAPISIPIECNLTGRKYIPLGTGSGGYKPLYNLLVPVFKTNRDPATHCGTCCAQLYCSYYLIVQVDIDWAICAECMHTLEYPPKGKVYRAESAATYESAARAQLADDPVRLDVYLDVYHHGIDMHKTYYLLGNKYIYSRYTEACHILSTALRYPERITLTK
jgi:hypothetical protein